MEKTLYFLFDPLCGWCYGIIPALSIIENHPDIIIQMLPTGLFSSPHPRLIDDAFAEFAWRNDRRIAELTGQVFSERYQQLVLGNRQQYYDSSLATLALTAVSLTAPTKMLATLKAIQHARFIDGKDVTDLSIIVSILNNLALSAAVYMLEHADQDLTKANEALIERAQVMLTQFGARGLPTLIAQSGKKSQKLDTRSIYSRPEALIHQINWDNTPLFIRY